MVSIKRKSMDQKRGRGDIEVFCEQSSALCCCSFPHWREGTFSTKPGCVAQMRNGVRALAADVGSLLAKLCLSEPVLKSTFWENNISLLKKHSEVCKVCGELTNCIKKANSTFHVGFFFPKIFFQVRSINSKTL